MKMNPELLEVAKVYVEYKTSCYREWNKPKAFFLEKENEHK